MSLISSDNIVQKGLAFGRLWSGIVRKFRAQGPREILPRRLHRRGGASVWGRDAAKPNGGSRCKSLQRSDRRRQRQPPFQRQNHRDTVLAILSRRGPIAARRRRGGQAPQAKARLEEGGRQPGLPNRERKSRQAHLSPAPPPAGLRAMPRVKIGPALPDREKLDAELARLRDLHVGQLRSRWHTAFGRPAPAHLARHLLFRSLAYRLQADRLGDLDRESQRLLDRSGSPEKAGRNAVDLSRQTTELRPGTILGREWNGQMQQVAVLADGFAWNGKTYPSLSKAAFAITGTRWNGPKFFGLRDKPAKASSP